MSLRFRFVHVGAALWLLCLVLLAGTASAQDTSAAYRLGAGDGIRITVFQNPNLTLETRISEDGSITYPLIGRVKVGGLTIAEAERSIAQALERGNFIAKPQVNIFPLAILSRQVSVLGLVNRPGRFPLETANTRLSEMIAIAGGIAPGGADIVILSGERDGKPFRKEVDLARMFLVDMPQDDVRVAGGDVIFVDRAPMYYIYGEVHRPGAYRIERGMTLRHALVQSGGPTPKGNERALRLYRRAPNGQLHTVKPDMNDLVRADDVLHVGESFF